MSQDFLKIMVHDFLKINVPRFFEIHGPWFFEIQCPKDFCKFGLLSRLAQAGGGGAYYMNFHYQKVTTSYYSLLTTLVPHCKKGLAIFPGIAWLVTSRLGTGKSLTFFYGATVAPVSVPSALYLGWRSHPLSEVKQRPHATWRPRGRDLSSGHPALSKSKVRSQSFLPLSILDIWMLIF